MKTKIEIELNPFGTPSRVKASGREYSSHEAPWFDLDQIDAETLGKMCDEFRLNIFKLARKSDPQRIQPPTCGEPVKPARITNAQHYDDRDHP